MMTIALLFLVGTLLLVGEMILPGGIAGIAGGIALFAGCWVAFAEFGTGIGTAATIAAFVLVGVALYLELVWLPKTRLGRQLVVDAKIDGRSQPPPADAAAVVGRTARAVTRLAPSGFVEVEGRRYEAFCRSGHVERGALLTVVGVDTFQLIVSEPKNP